MRRGDLRRDSARPALESHRRPLARARRRLAAAVTRRNDERFRGLFDAHPVPMYIFDRETLRFLAVNGAAVQQYVYSEAEFLGMTIRAIQVGISGFNCFGFFGFS